MRVLHVLEALEGGTARHVTDVVRHVGEVEHHVAVPDRRVGGGATDETAVPAMGAAGATIHRVEMRRLPVSPRNAAAVAQLGLLVRRLRPDVVHGHSSVGGALARLAAGDSDAFRVYTPNGLHPSALAGGAERLLSSRTDRLVAVSPSEARIAAARGVADPHRIATIPNGVDLDPAPAEAPSLRRLAGLHGDGPLIGFVGRLVPQKAPLDFVAAAASVANRRGDAAFVLVGSGRLEASVRSTIGARSLDGVVGVAGHVPRAAAAIDQLDVLVLPSRYEGCPYVALEAMRAGVPVVTTDAVGCRDVVEHGVTGLTAPVGDTEGLASDILRVLADPTSARRMVETARRRLAERFDVRTMAGDIALMYRLASR
ncbi:MAG TPA: glycosyltransferase [Acidimicrobiales bacterium]|nr:glycosyltransferase [Acidimicrobiales bacterium]